MNAIFISVRVFDPEGQTTLGADQSYGGEARLFVVKATDLIAGLLELLEALDTSGFALLGVNHAAPIHEFTPESFGFSVDIQAMTEDAVSSGEICVSPAYSYSLAEGLLETMVFSGLVDVFDPETKKENDRPYAGQIGYVASFGETGAVALRAVLNDFKKDEIVLRSLEDFEEVHDLTSCAYEERVFRIISHVKKYKGIKHTDFYAYESDQD